MKNWILCLLFLGFLFGSATSCRNPKSNNKVEHKEGDGHDHKDGDGHEHKEGDGHKHKEGDGHRHN